VLWSTLLAGERRTRASSPKTERSRALLSKHTLLVHGRARSIAALQFHLRRIQII
jgi:hypothetical protein